MTAHPIRNTLPPALLACAAALAAGNWYLDPARAAAWGAALVVLAVMAAALALSPRPATGRTLDGSSSSRAGEKVRTSVLFGALILALPLAAKLEAAIGWPDRIDWAHRLTMVAVGMFFVVAGNALPKTLTPLSATQCDAATVQAIQRLSGWTWVLTGLGFAVCWLVLPAAVAEPVSVSLIAAAILVIVTQSARLRRTRRSEA